MGFQVAHNSICQSGVLKVLGVLKVRRVLKVLRVLKVIKGFRVQASGFDDEPADIIQRE